jgi:CspA family cold shock protein
MTGKVKWYDEVKGYGFISTTEGKDIFVHRSGLDVSVRALDVDQEVEFDTKDGQKGVVAVNVKLAD